MMQRYQRGSSVRSDATQSSNDALDDVFGGGGSGQRLGTIFPTHIAPSTEERVAQANSLMAESFLSRSNAATSHREQQRRTIRQLCVDSDSDSDSYHPARAAVKPSAVESPRPSQARGATVPAASKLNSTQIPASAPLKAAADGPTSPQLPALRSSPLKSTAHTNSSPTPKARPDDLPAPKVSSPVIVTSADEPHLQLSRGRSPTTYFPPPPVVPPHRTASAEVLRHPTPPKSRGPGSSRTTPVAASFFNNDHPHEDGRLDAAPLSHPHPASSIPHHPTVDDEPSFEDVYRDYRGSASAERHSTMTSRRDEGLARPTAKRVQPNSVASWDTTSPRKSPSQQHTHGSSRISPHRRTRQEDDVSMVTSDERKSSRHHHDTDASLQAVRDHQAPTTAFLPRRAASITSPEAVAPPPSSRVVQQQQQQQHTPLYHHVRASPIRSDGSSPMDSVGSAERAHFAALTNSAPRNSTHITSTRVTTTAQHTTTTATVVTNNNPLQASLISSAKYKSTSPLPPAGRSTPPKAAPAKLASNGRTSTPQGKSSPAAARQVQTSTKLQTTPPAPQTRANSGAVLSQSGVFATETGLTFGACRCEEHDSICAFVHHDWLSAFLEYNKGARSSARLFNLDPVPITATVARGGDGQDRNTSPNNFRRRSSVIGAWCSVDVLQRRRADILPPKRFMMIAGGHLQDESVELSDGMHVLEPSELMLFPQEPFDVDTGLVKSLPSASFPLTTRGITQDANSTLVDHGALSSCSALTFTRVRLAPRKFHLVVEVIGVPLGPLLEEHDTVLFGSRQTSLNSADEFRRSHFAPPPQLKLVEQLIAALVQGDEHIDQTADGAQVLAGATFGLFDAGLFFDTYGTLLDVTNRNRSWLAERLRDIFGMTDSTSSRVATSRKQPLLQPSELLAQRQKKLLELFEVIKSPLVPLEFRAPPSLWNATVQRTFQLLDQDASLRSGMSSLTLENLHFRDVNPPAPSATAAGGNANGNAGMVTHDAFGVIKSAVQVPSNVLYDVRCLPQNKTQLYCPDSCKGSACDGDTAVVLEYISRFPFVQRIYSILADSSRYFVVLPPVLSKAVERSRAPAIQQQAQSEEIMSLSDLSRRVSPQLRTSQFMDYVRLIASQLVLSVGLLHSRAIVIGSLTPRRILCKVTHGAAPVRASMIETSLTGIGTSSAASSWLRQQKGVIEYLSPAFVSQFLDVKLLDPSLEGLSSPPRAPVDPPTTPTVGAADDWWAVGCALFELFSRGTPLFPVEGKGDLLDMWLTLLVNRDSHAPQTRDTVVEVARDNVVRHIEESVHFESDRLLKSWEPSTALGAPKAQPSTASSTSSNLVTRRVEERKRMDASRQPSPARNGSQAPLSEERHQWKQSVTEFVDVLSVLCDIQSFSPAPHKEGLCPSDFHGVVVRLMAMPFFKSVDWVNVFNQTPSSLSTGAHIVSPLTHRPGSSERSHSADSSKGAALRNSPRRQNTSRIASSPRLSGNALNQKSNMLGVPMEASEPSESGATNDYGRPHPFVMYTADEAAVLVNLLQRKGTARDREMADAIKRQDVRLHQWSVEAIPELSGRNSFLRPTESNQMYQRAVKERKRQLVSATDTGSPGKGDRDPSPNRAAPAPQSSDVYVMGGGSIRTNTLDSTSKGGGTQSMISPLHHSYSFQRPKGFIDVVSDRKVGCVYDPAPLRNQGDVTAYTKPLLSKSSKTAVSSRHQGYLDPVGARDKVGAYVPPPPPSKTFGPPPPLPSYHGKDAQSRLAQSISRPHPGGPVVDAPQSYRARAWIDHVAGSTEVPAVVVSPPTTRPIPHHGQALNLTSVSPETPRSDDPSVALFTSPPQAATARSTNAGTTTSGSTPAGGTPANRPAVRLPGTKSDASSDRSSVHEGRSEGHTSDASSRFRGQRDSPSGQNVAQRPPRHAQAAPVALPPGVSSVRSTSADAAVSMSGPFANSSSSHAAPQQRPLPKRIPAAKPLGRWEKSDSDDEKPRDTRPAAQSRRGPSRSPKSSPRRHSDPQGQPRAQQVNRRELPPPPPPYDPMDDEDDDAEFS